MLTKQCLQITAACLQTPRAGKYDLRTPKHIQRRFIYETIIAYSEIHLSLVVCFLFICYTFTMFMRLCDYDSFHYI